MLKSTVFGIAGLAITALLGLLPSVAVAGPVLMIEDPTYSSFGTATVDSGAIYNISVNGGAFNAVDNTTTITSGNSYSFQFGFSSATAPMVIEFTGGLKWDVSAVDTVYMVQNGPKNGTDALSVSSYTDGTIKDYNGSAVPPPWAGGAAPGANFPAFASGNFGNSNYLRMDSDANWVGTGVDPQQGLFGFKDLTSSATATGSIEFGAHVRYTVEGGNGKVNTAFVMLLGPGSPPGPPPQVGAAPEPASAVLLGLGLGGLALYRRLRRA